MTTRWITHEGKTHSMTEWARIRGMSECTLKYRLNSGWDVARALDVPVGSIKPKPPTPLKLPPLTPCTIDPDKWLRQVWDDPRRNSTLWMIAGAIYWSVKDGLWPMSVSDLARAVGVDRRSLQRMLPKLEHCGHVEVRYVHPNRVDIILIDKSAPAEPALMAAE